MANDRWIDDDPYRARRYGNDDEYERNFRRRNEGRGRDDDDERPARFSSLPVLGLDYSDRQRGYGRDRDSDYGRDDYGGSQHRYEQERYSQSRPEQNPYGQYGRERYGQPRRYSQDWDDASRGGDRYRHPYGENARYGYGTERLGYGNEGSRRDYGNDWSARGGPHERSWWDRTKDEVKSWMGDHDAEHRREADHRGRGPRGYSRSDDRIRDDVSDRLMEDRYVDASEIEVTVSGGEVTLSGTVDRRETRWRAENIAADVTGVKDVQNRLRTRSRDISGAARDTSLGSASQTSTATGTTTAGTTTAGTTTSGTTSGAGTGTTTSGTGTTTPRH